MLPQSKKKNLSKIVQYESINNFATFRGFDSNMLMEKRKKET